VSSNDIRVEGAKAFSEALCVNASLTSCNVLRNNMGVTAAVSLVDTVKDRDISLCGIQPDQKKADFRYKGLQPADAILLASDLSKAGVSASLTQVFAFCPFSNCAPFGGRGMFGMF